MAIGIGKQKVFYKVISKLFNDFNITFLDICSQIQNRRYGVIYTNKLSTLFSFDFLSCGAHLDNEM